MKKQSLPHAYAGIKACRKSVFTLKWLETTDFKDIFVGLMGLRPSCVKTAPRNVVAVQLFMITEQVIYICILSSACDTSPNSLAACF